MKYRIPFLVASFVFALVYPPAAWYCVGGYVVMLFVQYKLGYED